MAKLSKLKPRIKTINTSRGSSPATERIVGTTLQNIRRRILIRDDFKCQVCGKSYIDKYLEIDHIIPLSIGGPETDDNRQVLCVECHRLKSKTEEREGRAG